MDYILKPFKMTFLGAMRLKFACSADCEANESNM